MTCLVIGSAPPARDLGIEAADQWLIQAARSRASGANIHRINGLCQLFLYYQRLRVGREVRYRAAAEDLRARLQTIARSPGRTGYVLTPEEWVAGMVGSGADVAVVAGMAGGAVPSQISL